MNRGKDILIQVPGAGKRYEITDLSYTDGSYSGFGGASGNICYEAVASYKLNGVTISTGVSSSHGSPSTVWLKLER